MKKVFLITDDGSCLSNFGPGGWACVLRFGSAKKEFFGFDPQTTNNSDGVDCGDPDGRPHAPLPLGLGRDYVPKPQASLFGEVKADIEDEVNR